MVTPVEAFVLTLREAGITLVLLWVLTLAIVWGLLSHANIPKSGAVRGIIALTSAFLMLLAAAASPAVAFLQTLIVSSILIAFGLLVGIVFLELIGARDAVSKHGVHLGFILLLLLVAIFVGAGGLGVIPLPALNLDPTVIAFVIFTLVIVAAVWIMLKEVGEKK